MKEEEERKRASEETRGVGFLASKRLRETVTDELADDVKAWLSVEDSETDSVSELLKLLDDSPEDTTSASSSTSSPTLFGMRVRFSDNPYSSALIFQSSSSYITINGNEESCGSSFSDSESSVMASVDMGGILNANVKVGSGLKGIRGREEAEGGGGTWDRSEEEARGWMMDWKWEWDEEQLVRFLGEEEEEIPLLKFGLEFPE